MSLHDLQDEIATLAGHMHAAMCRWLTLVAELDAREGWPGFKTCAHWVSWRCGVAPRAAREHVRVARWLTDKPLVREAFSRGELSYSKVRALARADGVDNEEELLRFALTATAAQLERIMRGYGRVLALDANRVHERRYLTLSTDEDGSVVVRGRLPAEDAAVLEKALEIARAELVAAHPADDRTHKYGAANVDALAAVVQGYLDGPDPHDGMRDGGDRFQVVLHVDRNSLAGGKAGERCETESGTAISAETARRLSCDAAVVAMVERNGRPVSVGRKTRTIPPALRRALQSRDGGCRFPGCTSRRHVHAHHIHHWARGGATALPNLVQLCRYHHRLVHEGGFTVEHRGDSLIFTTPHGQTIPAAPRTRGDCGALKTTNRRRGIDPGPQTSMSSGRGERYDLGMAVDAVWSWRAPSRASPAIAV